MRTYLKVRWLHDFDVEPVVLFSELDEARNETQKIELFRGGSYGFASSNAEHGGSFLALTPTPSLAEINSDPQFKASEITKIEFEEVWGKALENT